MSRMLLIIGVGFKPFFKSLFDSRWTGSGARREFASAANDAFVFALTHFLLFITMIIFCFRWKSPVYQTRITLCMVVGFYDIVYNIFLPQLDSSSLILLLFECLVFDENHPSTRRGSPSAHRLIAIPLTINSSSRKGDKIRANSRSGSTSNRRISVVLIMTNKPKRFSSSLMDAFDIVW